MAKMIGIDLGTTNSCAAVIEGGKPVVIPNAEGQRTTPSVVAFTKAGERLVGEPAKRQAVTNAPRTVTSIKRQMGSDSRVPIDGKCYSPQEISALILQKLKADAEAYLGEPVTQAVITVPAYFNDAQRQATKDAGRIAGLEVKRIINEPTAAALAYGLDNGKAQTVMVYDLGGGTFDVSLIQIGDGIVQVLSTCGDNYLGGDDFDARIVNWLADNFKAAHGVDLTTDRVAMQRLREEAEKAKKELSPATQTELNLPFITTGPEGALHLQATLTRAKFEELYSKFKTETDAAAEKVRAAGGLYILGTERHESRRIDNQLRGRSGRQGDPGESRFYISLEDDLMRLFGSERLMKIFTSLGVAENEQIEHKMLSNAIEKAQEKIEFNNFGIRKNLLDYDQVNNEQREIIYKERRQVLDGENMREAIYKMIQDTVDTYVDMCFSDDVDSEEWDLNEFNGVLLPVIPVQPLTLETVKGKKRDEIKHALKEEAVKLYEAKEAEFPEPEQLRELERVVLLKCIDSKWMDHIDDMEILRQGIGLAAYGQRDPVVEYKMSAFEMFNNMITSIQEDTLRMLYHVHVEQKIEREQVAKVTGTNKDDSAGPKKPVQRKEIKVYPNDPCPCGSGKKYKQCCGRKNKA